MPSLYNHFIIVKPEYVALNPTDVLHIDQLPSPGAIVGCDYSGVVEQVGEAVTNGLRKGDRVAGCVHGSMPLTMTILNMSIFSGTDRSVM